MNNKKTNNRVGAKWERVRLIVDSHRSNNDTPANAEHLRTATKIPLEHGTARVTIPRNQRHPGTGCGDQARRQSCPLLAVTCASLIRIRGCFPAWRGRLREVHGKLENSRDAEQRPVSPAGLLSNGQLHRPLLADTATMHWEPLSKDQEPKSPFACAPRCRRDGCLAVRTRRFDHWCRSYRLDDHRLQIVGRVHLYLARSGRPRAAT